MALTSFDKYSLNARLYPALIVFLPIGFTIAAFFPEKFSGYDFLIAIITTCGLSYFLEHIARDQGKKLENSLFKEWGGKPTTQMLRHRDTLLDKISLTRYHRKLESLIEGMKLPTQEQELNDPNSSDSIYDSCTKFLIANTRDQKKFPLVFAENVNYGFRRNLWGMKSASIIILVLSIAAILIPIYFNIFEIRMIVIIALLLDIFLLVMWLFRINKNWVKVPAFEYAKHLMNACDRL